MGWRGKDGEREEKGKNRVLGNAKLEMEEVDKELGDRESERKRE